MVTVSITCGSDGIPDAPVMFSSKAGTNSITKRDEGSAWFPVVCAHIPTGQPSFLRIRAYTA